LIVIVLPLNVTCEVSVTLIVWTVVVPDLIRILSLPANTVSLKVKERFASSAIFVAPLTGVPEEIVGAMVSATRDDVDIVVLLNWIVSTPVRRSIPSE
jgi:hypothetical protein